SSSAPSTPSISPLSLHDALPISSPLPASVRALQGRLAGQRAAAGRSAPLEPAHALDAAPVHPEVALHRERLLPRRGPGRGAGRPDRKSTRLNSSHVKISYAVFCL